MTRILFVDDEPKILTGLRRSLRRLRNEWDMQFAEGGANALEACAARQFDIVVSDARMPGMEGRVLLERIMTEHPDTARIILSGQCSRLSAMKCVDVCHQFLNKPCDQSIIESTVRRICEMRDLFDGNPLRPIMTAIQWLPYQDIVGSQLACELDSDETTAEKVAALIGTDVGLSAKMIQLVSSGFFGTAQHARSPQNAADLLGLEALKELLETSDVFQRNDHRDGNSVLELGNEHSRAVSQVARRIASSMTDDTTLLNDATLAGLLHEIGTLATLSHAAERCPQSSDSSQSATEEDGQNSSDRSTELEIGGYLAALWGLPDSVVQAITYHRQPRRSTAAGSIPLTAVHVANALLEHQHSEFGAPSASFDEEYLRQIDRIEQMRDWQAMTTVNQMVGN
jgi:HD-like signal output (HDOD) protein